MKTFLQFVGVAAITLLAASGMFLWFVSQLRPGDLP